MKLIEIRKKKSEFSTKSWAEVTFCRKKTSILMDTFFILPSKAEKPKYKNREAKVANTNAENFNMIQIKSLNESIDF